MPNYSSSQPCGLDFIISVLQIRKYRLSGAKSFSYTAHLSNRHLTIELWLQNLWLFYSTKELQTLSFIYLFIFLTLHYCIGFAIHWHESATGVHVFPILNPPPTSLPIPSLWIVPVHQPRASCIMHRTWTGDSFHIWYYTCLNAIFPNHPPPLPQSTKDCSIHLCLFCCLAYRVIVTIFLNSIYMR